MLAVPAVYYCAPHVQAMSDKLHELEAQAPKRSDKKSKKRTVQVKDKDGDEGKADEVVVVNQLKAFVKQRRDIVAASQKVRRFSLSALALSTSTSTTDSCCIPTGRRSAPRVGALVAHGAQGVGRVGPSSSQGGVSPPSLCSCASLECSNKS